MFCDRLGSRASASLMPNQLRAALARLPELASLPAGRYPIDGERLFALVQALETHDNQRFEVHARYLDVQYLVSGVEKIAYLPEDTTAQLIEDRLQQQDYALYSSSERASELILHPGMFVLFYPGELHRPCCMLDAPTAIKKVVLKFQSDQEGSAWNHA